MKTTTKKNLNQSITRMDYQATRGWNLRFTVNKAQVSCFLADSKFGGRNRTLGFARRLRDAAVKELQTKKLTAIELKEFLSSRRELKQV